MTVCSNLLEMDAPTLLFKRTAQMSNSAKGRCEFLDGKVPVIYLDPGIKYGPECILIIAHELRHIYQYCYLPNVSIELFKPSQDEDLSINDYNQQFLEIDANAFAEICVEYILGITPYWGLSQENIKSIKKRKTEVLSTEFGVKSL